MENNFAHGYALLIGVGTTDYLPWSLPVTVKDVQAIRKVLTDTALCGYPDNDEHLRLLHDQDATRVAILDGLQWLKDRAGVDPDATVVVFYSGHGWLDQTSGRYFLIPHDVKPYNITGSALSGEEFTAALREIRACRLLVIIDSCHAEGMATSKEAATALDLPVGLTQAAATEGRGLLAALKQGEGRAVFTSSRGTQKSWVRSDGSLSMFTHHLLEGFLGAGNKPGDTEVHLSNLMSHLEKSVPASTRQMYSAEQEPFFDMASTNFPVSLLRGGKGLPNGGWDATKLEAEANIQRVVNVVASGERAVAVGNMSGGTIIAGDTHNVTTRNDQKGIGPEAASRLYKVWFGTNREPFDSTNLSAGFTGLRGDRVRYGSCTVSIPRSHRFGSVGSSWWRRWLTLQDDRLAVVERLCIPQENFWTRLATEFAKLDRGEKQALIFLHGFNVSFDEAAVRAAQIGFDLKFPGVTAFFSWPSAGTLAGYPVDESSIESSEQDIATFLRDVVARSGADCVHIIAHSMGNRGLLRALQRIMSQTTIETPVRFGQIILAAPDIDQLLFKSLSDVYAQFAQRTTMYVSPADRAVAASAILHSYPRVGLTPPVTVVTAIDTIEVPSFDVFDLLGHSYYAEAEGLLYDMFDLIARDAPPESRMRLERTEELGGSTYWIMNR